MDTFYDFQNRHHISVLFFFRDFQDPQWFNPVHDGRIAAFHCQDISQCHIWFFHLGILFPFDIKYFISRRHLYPSFLLPVAPARSAFLHLPGLSPGHHYNSRSFRSEQLSAGHKEHSPRYIFFFFPIASASFVICFR